MKGYEKLDDVLARAYKQASEGKGAERHANELPFHEQPMQQINRMVGVGFTHGQAIKKIVESQNMAPEQAVHELLGAIVYIAGGIISLEAANDNKSGEPIKAVSMTMFVDGEPLNLNPSFQDIKFATVEYLDDNFNLVEVEANGCISGTWIRVPEGADTLAGDTESNRCRYFWDHTSGKMIGTGESLERYPEWEDFDGNTAQAWLDDIGRPHSFAILWQRKTPRDQAREQLLSMDRGEMANINGHMISYNHQGLFVEGYFYSDNIDETLDYLFDTKPPTSREQARKILSKLVRGESATIDGVKVTFDRDGYFHARLKGYLAEKTKSLNGILNYLENGN